MNTKPLLRLLADGAIHSGESLADALGVSRTAIWKQVRKLQEQGVHVGTIRGRGYQLAEAMDLLSHEGILGRLHPAVQESISLVVHDKVDSTNTDITRRWQKGESGLLVSIADCQEQGRGRRGRPWQSPVGKNLYMSVGMTISRGFTELEGLSLVAGLALIESLEFPEHVTPALKWPNDLLLDGRKLAGILIELQGELEGSVRVIIGIGLNVHMTQADAVDQPWTSLSLASPMQRWTRNQLASDLLNQLSVQMREFEQEGFGPFAARWNQYDAFRGKGLRATTGDLAGTGRGVDDAGNYLVETGDGLQRVSAGEISLRTSS